ncbi:GIY-YIG nuclease family protein [Metabacillus sp. JX24]|uniref:GIY-YIG nuclease family protein n=1 Tax=Metabacillus sp. JX24 TaxID=3240759 RepID=UPI00350F2193
MSNFKVKFTKFKRFKTKLSNKSGLYYFYLSYNPEELLYVGEAIDLYRRLGQYEKDKGEGHNNQRVVELIKNELNSLMVAFQPINVLGKNKKELKKYLKVKEANVIQELVPLFNVEENPRYLIHPIQKVIGEVVSKASREITFSYMREYLFLKWWGIVPYERIDKALANKQFHLSRYCKTSQKNKILNPKAARNKSRKMFY